ncbi:MAG: hypothetical protein ISQ34_00550 [Rickettsiales bacterium]|nr:hypothetical protein [Rickettsiales bacterium]
MLERNHLVNSIGDVFDQYKKMILAIGVDVFCKDCHHSSSLGAHVRHVLDRANCVVEGFEFGEIDYDNRRRQSALETNPELCVQEFDRIFWLIKEFDGDVKNEVEVSETANEDGMKVRLKSSFEREFWDIVLHGVHHLATIKFILEKNGVVVDKDFGKNMSTVIYERG